MAKRSLVLVVSMCLGVILRAESPRPTAQQAPPSPLSTERPPSRLDILRGEYGRYRATNDLLSYHLDGRGHQPSARFHPHPEMVRQHIVVAAVEAVFTHRQIQETGS